jgi:type IX secretion system PorP/SprF family membrane protein
LYFIQVRHIFFSKWLLCLCFFLVSGNSIKAQKVFSPYPFQFDQLFSYSTIINPAASYRKNDFIQVGYNGFNMLSNNLATYYLNLRIDLGKDSSFKAHKLGLYFINDKEGAYLNRLKLMGQYAYSVQLSDRTIWTTGASAGFVNNSLKPNDAVGGESSFILPDADLGTWINHGKFYGGISLNQIFYKHVSFLNGNYLRRRYTSYMMGFEKDISASLTLKTDLYFRSGPELYNKYVAGINVIIKDHFIAGITVKSNNGMIPMVGVKGIPVLEHQLKFLFSWRVPTSKTILAGTGNSEIMLEYTF